MHTRPFLDLLFNCIEKAGTNTKIHGLACTGSEMAEYPFYSVDSAAWMFQAANGCVYYLDGMKLKSKPSSSRQVIGTTNTVTASFAERANHNILVIKELMDKINRREQPKPRKSLF
jgi:hypothetical protein